MKKKETQLEAKRATDIGRMDIQKINNTCSAKPHAYDVVTERVLDVGPEKSNWTLPLASGGILDKAILHFWD